jgi:phospholipid/cholesterol/gamma-HCH transport system ATP-binding protein
MIQFIDVYKAWGSNRVLNGLSISIPKGKISFILGKSGEGKSVTIKHIMGLLAPDKGKVIVEGDDISQFSERDLRVYRRKFGMLFQHAALFDSLTVEENISFPIREHTKLTDQQRMDRVHEVLDQVGLPGVIEKYPSQLSTGEKKRIGLARALAAKPKVILYDEPTTGMDPLVSEMIDDLIVKVSRDNPDLTSVVISHDLKAALATGDNLVMLYKGKVALEGAAEDFRQSQDPIIRQFFSGKVEGPMEFL